MCPSTSVHLQISRERCIKVSKDNDLVCVYSSNCSGTSSSTNRLGQCKNCYYEFKNKYYQRLNSDDKLMNKILFEDKNLADIGGKFNDLTSLPYKYLQQLVRIYENQFSFDVIKRNSKFGESTVMDIDTVIDTDDDDDDKGDTTSSRNPTNIDTGPSVLPSATRSFDYKTVIDLISDTYDTVDTVDDGVIDLTVDDVDRDEKFKGLYASHLKVFIDSTVAADLRRFNSFTKDTVNITSTSSCEE